MSKETDTGNESGYKTDTDEVEAIKTTIIPARDGLFQSTTTSTPELNVLSSSITDEGIVDPITQAIRDQILTAQREILRLEISRQNPELAEQLENDKKFREFLKNLKDEEEKRKLVYAVLNDKEIKGELEKIEINGYRNIHKQFENRFKPMLWDGDKGEDANKNTTQSQKVTNDVGDEICTLTETTHAINPIQILDGNNQPVTIKSYRTIDFPTKLDGAAGNMHLSIVALDKNGNKPSIDKAVYFTAHYEEGPNGKPLLKEISSPMPIKFMGEGKEAIGYIEHGGEIYTMPVTRGKYEAMMQEVAVNKGHSVDLSQTVKEIANDKVMNMSQEQGGKSIVDGYKAIAEKYADLQKNPEGKLPEELSKEELKDKTAFIKDLSNNNNSLGDKDKAVILDELVKYETERGENAIGDGKIAIDKTIEMLDTEKGILNERIMEQDKAKVSKETETAKLFSELPFHDNKAKEEILGVSETTTSPLQQVKTTQPPQPLHAEMDTVSTPSSTSENVQQVEALTAQLMANLEGSSSNRSTEEEAAKQKFYTSAKAVIDTTTELVDKIPDSKVIAKADNIKNILSNSAPIYSKENQKKQIIDEYNKQNTIDEQKVFIENKLVQNKGLSKEDRLGIIDDLIKQQDKRRSIAVEGPYDKDNKAATVSISLEETELKPISEEKPNIEKAQRQVDIDKVNVKGDVSIRAVLTEARGKINEEPTISVQNVANPKRQEIKR